MFGLLTAGVQQAQGATPATALGNGASTGDGNKLVPDQGVRVTDRPKNYMTPKGLKVEREIVNISDLKFNLNGYDLGDRILVMPQKMGGGVNLLDLAPAELWHHSGTGTMAITTRSATIFKPFRVRILTRSSSSSTVARAA